jgi:hypothetical protein
VPAPDGTCFVQGATRALAYASQRGDGAGDALRAAQVRAARARPESLGVNVAHTALVWIGAWLQDGV